jgi:hypothetical protein
MVVQQQIKSALEKRRKKQAVIAIVTLVLLVGFSIFLLSKGTSVGKGIDDGIDDELNQDVCLTSCTFKTIYGGDVKYVTVAQGESGYTYIGKEAYNIKVIQVEENVCRFVIQNILSQGYTQRDLTLHEDLYEYNDDTTFELFSIQHECQECIEPNAEYTTLSYVAIGYDSLDSRISKKANITIQPQYILDSVDGIKYNTCRNNITVLQEQCIGNTTELSCNDGFTCQEGVCTQCTELSKENTDDVELEFTPDQIKQRFQNYCIAKSYVQFSCSDNQMVIEKEECAIGCYPGKSYNDDPICLNECVDTDQEDITIQGNTTGIKINDFRTGFREEVWTEQDGCLNEQVVIEKSCNANGYISTQRHTCPDHTVCRQGACINAPPTFFAQEISTT